MSNLTILDLEDRLHEASSALTAARARIAELERRLREATEWRPMATAPRDGTHIQVCFGPYSATWTFQQRPPTVAHWFGPSDLPGLRSGGWYLSVQQSEGPRIHPTHWLPLPAAPEATDADHKG